MRSDQVDFDEEVIDAGSELGLGSRVSVLWPYEYVSVFVVPRAKPKEDLDGADTPSLKAWCKEAHVAVGGTDTLRRRRLKDPARYQLSAAPPTSVRKKTRGWFTAHVVNRLDGDEFTLLFDVSTVIKPTSGSRLDDRYQRTYLRATKLVSRDEWPPAGDLNWCRGTHRDVGRDEAKWPTDPEPLSAASRRDAFLAQLRRVPSPGLGAASGGDDDNASFARTRSAALPARGAEHLGEQDGRANELAHPPGRVGDVAAPSALQRAQSLSTGTGEQAGKRARRDGPPTPPATSPGARRLLYNISPTPGRRSTTRAAESSAADSGNNSDSTLPDYSDDSDSDDEGEGEGRTTSLTSASPSARDNVTATPSPTVDDVPTDTANAARTAPLPPVGPARSEGLAAARPTATSAATAARRAEPIRAAAGTGNTLPDARGGKQRTPTPAHSPVKPYGFFEPQATGKSWCMIHAYNNATGRQVLDELEVNTFLDAREEANGGARLHDTDYEIADGHRYDFGMSFVCGDMLGRVIPLQPPTSALGPTVRQGQARQGAHLRMGNRLGVWTLLGNVLSAPDRHEAQQVLDRLKRMAAARPGEARGFVFHTGGHHYAAIRGANFRALATGGSGGEPKDFLHVDTWPTRKQTWWTQAEAEAELMTRIMAGNGVALVGEGDPEAARETARLDRKRTRRDDGDDAAATRATKWRRGDGADAGGSSGGNAGTGSASVDADGDVLVGPSQGQTDGECTEEGDTQTGDGALSETQGESGGALEERVVVESDDEVGGGGGGEEEEWDGGGGGGGGAQGRAAEAKGREMTAKRAREGDSISTSAEQDRGASGRMGVAAVATARGIDNRPAWMTEGQGVKRARELEEAGVATRAARAAAGAGLEATGTASTKRAAAEGGAMAAMSRPLKVGKPSQVKHNERRSLATAGAPVGTRREVSAVGVTTTKAAATAAGGGDVTAATATTGTKKQRRSRKGHGSAKHKARRGQQ
jgi:hypothetical protein